MRTVLYDIHRALGAKMVEFSGWEMPIQYKGIIHEHTTVREHVGLFDVSHMGRILIEGPDAESLLDYLSTNEIGNKSNGSTTYTVWCTESGMCVDDLIVYKESPTQFFVIVNAGNRQKDLEHLRRYAQGKKVTFTDHYALDGILAVQGPQALPLITKLFPEASDLVPKHFVSSSYRGETLILSRTGYTGEEGYEIYASNQAIVSLWQELLQQGQPYGIEPIGLGARDTLRLEMGYALYGHEISDAIAPSESVSAWTVKWQKEDFLGKTSLLQLQEKPRHEYGVVLKDRGIAREGFPVFKDNQRIGYVTSGTFSPSLSQAIAIVLVEKNLHDGDSVDIQIRQNLCRAEVVPLPFYKKKKG